MSEPLFDLGEFTETPAVDGTLEEKAVAWMEEHPEIMGRYENMALTFLEGGRKFGISQLTEQIRWTFRTFAKAEKFKIPNNHRAYIIRELVRRHPKIAHLVTLHPVQGERAAS